MYGLDLKRCLLRVDVRCKPSEIRGNIFLVGEETARNRSLCRIWRLEFPEG